MDKLFIKARMAVAVYAKKSGTATSYYLNSGSIPLPSRLSISFGSVITSATRKGRMISQPVVGEIRGEFTRKEASPLKQHHPYKINSKIFRMDDYPLLAGYGTVAVSDADGHTKQEEGIVVFAHCGDGGDGNLLKLFFMAGQCLPETIQAFCEAVTDELKKGE